MTSPRISTLIALAVGTGVLGYLLLDLWERTGADPLPVPWTAPVGLIMLAGLVLGAGWQVRRWVLGRRQQPLNPLQAARIAVLATASSYVGAVFTGWYLAQAAVILPALVGDRRERFWMALAGAGAAAVFAVAGMVAQYWCRRPTDERDEESQELP